MDKATYDYYADTTNSCQWQEKQSSRQSWDSKYSSFKPREWTKRDIDTFKEVLAKSYDCSPSLLFHEFVCIDNEEDDQKSSCINLVYHIKCEPNRQVETRQIYSIKILIPEEIKQRLSKRPRLDTMPTPIKPTVKK